MHDVHVYHRIEGSRGVLIFMQNGKAGGRVELTAPAYKSMIDMLDRYNPSEHKIRLIPAPADVDLAVFAVSNEGDW